MHLVILTHLSIFWVECHPNRTSPPKEPERESQNILPPSPYHQTIPSITFDPWPSAPVWAVVHAFAISCRFVWSCCAFCCLVLTLYGVNKSLGLHSLHLISYLGWVIAWAWALSSLISPCLLLLLVFGSIGIPATPLHFFCRGIAQLVLSEPPLGLPYIIPSLIHVA